MKKIIRALIAVLTLSFGSLVYADYGLIPLSNEVHPDLKIGNDISSVFLGILRETGLKVQPVDQPSINYQMAESPEVTIEPAGEDVVKQQLQALFTKQHLEGVIFGHIMQDLVKKTVYVIVRVSLVSHPEQYETFGYEEAMGIKVADVTPQMIRERLVQVATLVTERLGMSETSSQKLKTVDHAQQLFQKSNAIIHSQKALVMLVLICLLFSFLALLGIVRVQQIRREVQTLNNNLLEYQQVIEKKWLPVWQQAQQSEKKLQQLAQKEVRAMWQKDEVKRQQYWQQIQQTTGEKLQLVQKELQSMRQFLELLVKRQKTS